jgi:hypothetical protein
MTFDAEATFFLTRFRASDFGLLWISIKGYTNHVCGEQMPIYLL